MNLYEFLYENSSLSDSSRKDYEERLRLYDEITEKDIKEVLDSGYRLPLHVAVEIEQGDWEDAVGAILEETLTNCIDLWYVVHRVQRNPGHSLEWKIAGLSLVPMIYLKHLGIQLPQLEL